MDDIKQRADTLLSRAEEATKKDMRAMFAEQGPKGQTGSGKTIIRAVDLYHNRLSEALSQVQSEIGKQIDHRGRKWNSAIGSVQRALEEAETRANAIFEPVWRGSRAINSESALRAGENYRAEAFIALKAKVAEFGEGWTAPRPRAWHERHPVQYAAVSALSGALLTLAAQAVGSAITPKAAPQALPASAPAPTSRPSPDRASSQSPGPASDDPSHDPKSP